MLMAIIISSIFLLLAVFMVRIVYNCVSGTDLLVEREQAFWLAEAGLEDAKVRLARNSNWFTDPTHYPEEDLAWLKNGARGEEEGFGEGKFKLIREEGRQKLYSIGMKGAAVVVLEVKFLLSPFKATDWKEI